MEVEELLLKTTLIGVVFLLLGYIFTKIYRYLSKKEDRLISDFEILYEFSGVVLVILGLVILLLNFCYFIMTL